MLKLLSLAVAALICLASFASAAEPSSKSSTQQAAQVLIVIGPSSHPPGSHEVAAGGRLLAHALEHSENLRGVQAEVVTEWPQDRKRLEQVATVVFIGDTFPPMRMPQSEKIMQELAAMTARGCGIVCLHYATGLRAEDVAADGEHPLLHWMGGYFATRCNHHKSIAKIFPAATITPAAPDHPVSRGWKEFTLHDEPYINNYFGPDGNKLAAGVTAFATSQLPPEDPQTEIVAWGVERPDGGRGFGIVMPHFYKNWALDDLRTFILNGVVWSAKVEVPKEGVRTAAPDLAAFAPGSIEPKPREPKPAAKK
ncbi:MAG: hypothetical protein C0483_08870 [Pirellula sp.]|nr:hypothetical protein [Pirellula sp.]